MAVRCILALALTGGMLNAPAGLVTAAIACPYQRCLGIFSPDPADKFVQVGIAARSRSGTWVSR